MDPKQRDAKQEQPKQPQDAGRDVKPEPEPTQVLTTSIPEGGEHAQKLGRRPTRDDGDNDDLGELK
jgi:hypothetical protein